MDLPMAAKKTRKPTKTTGKKAAKPARRPARAAAKPKPGKPARPKAKVKRPAPKASPRGKARPEPKAKRPTVKVGKAKTKAKARPEPKAKRPVARPLERKKKLVAAKPAPRPVEKERAAPLSKRKVERPAPAPAASQRGGSGSGAPPARGSAPTARASKPGQGPASVPSGRPSRTSGSAPPPAGSKRGAPSRGAPPSDRRSDPRGLHGGRARGAPLREAPARLVSLPLPVVAPPKRPSIEERAASIETRLAAATEEFRRRYEESLDMSWIYHDSALEGVVYTFDELRTALSGQAPPVTDSSLQPTYDDIRRHKEAIEFVRDFGIRKKLPVTVDIIKKIYLILHPEEGDIKTVKYRKDIPQHRLYFHEYAPPDKIAYKVRQIVDWLNDPETRKTRNGIRIAARAHYDLLRVYPFPTDSGKSARLFMNLLLMRTGLPPAIVHSTERQRYYEALKGSATTVLQMVQEAVENALSSVEKLLDEHETRKRAFVS
jgi:hypothetical protein